MADSDRHVEFEASFNFRDLGGYETRDGLRVRPRAVYRSDTLQRLTTNDLEVAAALGLRTVIDLRSTAEVTQDGRYPRADEVDFHHLPLFERESLPFVPAQTDDPEPPPGEDYVAFALHGRHAVAQVLRVIAEGEHAVVFHCAAGKDRTGVVAAILLAVLGVPDETIAADYALSARAHPLWLEWADANAPDLAAETRALPPWLQRSSVTVIQAFLDLLRAEHGSIEGYLADTGADGAVVETLRARLLISGSER